MRARRKAARGRCAGWLLIEILVVLGLFAIFLVVGSRLFVATTRATGTVERVQGEVARFDAAVRWLREDAWGAAAIEAAEGGRELRLAGGAGGEAVVWSVEGEGSALVRRSDGGERRFEGLGQRVAFESGPASAVLVATFGDAPADEARVRLVSQVLLAEAMR